MPINKNCMNLIRRYDEYYTRYEQVKDIFENYIPNKELRDKIIYCPCDSDESNFVIYLKEHKEDIGYKELIYTWDDYNTHLDLFEKCDIIITNPPFSKLTKEFIPILNKVNKKFFIFGSKISLGVYYNKFEDKNIHFQVPVPYFNFIVPEDCSYPDDPMYEYIYNIEGIRSYYSGLIFKHPKEPIKGHDVQKTIYYNFDRLEYIPKDFNNYFLCPVTVLLEHNRQYVDVIPEKLPKILFEDEKNRYCRILCKLKK